MRFTASDQYRSCASGSVISERSTASGKARVPTLWVRGEGETGSVGLKTYSELEHGLRRPRDVIARVVRRERDRGADVVEGAGNRRGMRAGEATVRCQSRVLHTKHDVNPIAYTRTKKTYHVTRRLHVYDVEQIAAAAEVPDGPLDGVLGLLGAVDGDHEVALVLVVAGGGGVERWEGSFPQETGGVS